MPVFARTAAVVLLCASAALSGCAGQSGPGSLKSGYLSSLSLRPDGSSAAVDSSGLIAKLDGGIIGRRIGSKLDRSSRTRALEAEYRALEETPGGQPVKWRSADEPASGTVVAAPPYQVGSQNCRQYTHKVVIDGVDAEARGAACRNDDGSWTPLT